MLTQKGGHMKENKLTSKDLITTGIYTARNPVRAEPGLHAVRPHERVGFRLEDVVFFP